MTAMEFEEKKLENVLHSKNSFFYDLAMGVAILVRARPCLVFSFPFHSSRTMEEKTDLSLLSSPYLT